MSEQTETRHEGKLGSSAAGLGIAVLFAAVTAAGFRLAWDPGAAFYFYNVPIALPFAAFAVDRCATGQARRALVVDGAVLVLALARVFVPPFPFVSGHALFAAYACLTASGWVLRSTAAVALVATAGVKIALWSDWRSTTGGVALAVVAALVRLAVERRSVRTGGEFRGRR